MDGQTPVDPNNPLGIKIESIMNQEDGTLPFGYYSPETDGKLTWNCGHDPDGKIISVFCYDFGTHKDKKIAHLQTMKDAIFARDQLIEAGWNKLKAPEITVSYDGGDKPLNRKQKRYLARKMKKLQKQNPFSEDSDGAPPSST